MGKEIDELVDSISNIGKYIIKRVVAAAHEAEGVVATSASTNATSCRGAAPSQAGQAAVDFHLGEWRRFTEGGEAYRVMAPLRQSDGDWIMRIQTKDGTQAEYPLSNILRNPPLVTEVGEAE
ncbi:MAG: DUF5397 family protein [Acidithiobacillus sp.]|nr:DUF5397 family protein [Acidithiobacillus sp.]